MRRPRKRGTRRTEVALSLRDRFLLEYARLSDPPVRWLASAPPLGGALDAAAGSEGLGDPGNPTPASTGARFGNLAAHLGVTNPTAQLGLNALMSQIPVLGVPIAMVNAIGKIGDALADTFGIGVGLTPTDVDVAVTAEHGEADPGIGEVGDPGIGMGIGAVGVGEPGEGSTGEGAEGSPGAPGVFRQGGVVRDRLTRARGEEIIVAHEGEYVVRQEPARKHRRLLDAINAGRSRKTLRAVLR